MGNMLAKLSSVIKKKTYFQCVLNIQFKRSFKAVRYSEIFKTHNFSDAFSSRHYFRYKTDQLMKTVLCLVSIRNSGSKPSLDFLCFSRREI